MALSQGAHHVHVRAIVLMHVRVRKRADRLPTRYRKGSVHNRTHQHCPVSRGKFLEEKCTKNGGPGAFVNVQRAEVNMKQCLQSLINITDVRAEIKKYKPTGNLDIMFKNYCNERFIKRSCSDNYTVAMKHCVTKTEVENEKIVKLTDSLLNSICYKAGELVIQI